MRIVIALLTIVLAGCGQRVVTRTVQVERFRPAVLPALPTIEAPTQAASIGTNGDLWDAWLHDSRELGKCKPAIDGIRALQPH